MARIGNLSFEYITLLTLYLRMPLQQYPLRHFDSDGLFSGPVDSYLSAPGQMRFEGYEFADYPPSQDMSGWAMPSQVHPNFYSFSREDGNFPRDPGFSEPSKSGNNFYYDFAHSGAKGTHYY